MHIINLKDSFIDDPEKMRDFPIMSKKDFLNSYSYLTEKEYNSTMIDWIKEDLYHTLWNFVGFSYAESVYEEIVGWVIDDIIVSSAVSEGGWYNDDDMRLAIGRGILKSLGKIEI